MASGPLKRQLDDLTECPICAQAFTDPRTLPCVHTYCLTCIEICCKGKRPGDFSNCAICRAPFRIPESGPIGLPKNFLIGKVIELKDSAGSLNNLACDACSVDGTDPVNRKFASSYCVDCQEKLCDGCDENHAKFKTTHLHKRFKLEAEDFVASGCGKHKGRKIELYCFDCKIVLCMRCFNEMHQSHKCLELADVVDEFRVQISADIKSLTDIPCQVKTKLADILLQKDLFVDKVSTAQKEITEHASHMKQLIDEEKDELLNELDALLEEGTRQMNSSVEKLQSTEFNTDGLKADLVKLLRKGTDCEIVQQAGKLHDQSSEILKSDLLLQIQNSNVTCDVTFKPSPAITLGSTLFFGKLDVNKMVDVEAIKTITPTTLTRVLRGAYPVVGVTSLGDRLYVVRSPCNHIIEVFDSSNFTPLTSLDVPRLSDVMWWGHAMTSCAVHNCIYVSDGLNYVHRVQLNAVTATKWLVDNGPTGLSVNSSNNILVTCRWSNQIQEYTTAGVLVKEISMLADNLSRPWHAIQLNHQGNDYYVVSHNGPVDGISKVNAQGQVVYTYQSMSASSSSKRRFAEPKQICVLSNGCFIVADKGNDRIVGLNSTLRRCYDILLPVDGGIKGPFTLHMDESQGRLYVGEYQEGRVLVFDNVWM